MVTAEQQVPVQHSLNAAILGSMATLVVSPWLAQPARNDIITPVGQIAGRSQALAARQSRAAWQPIQREVHPDFTPDAESRTMMRKGLAIEVTKNAISASVAASAISTVGFALTSLTIPFWGSASIVLGSGLVDHSQKMTVAARATAEKKTVGQRS